MAEQKRFLSDEIVDIINSDLKTEDKVKQISQYHEHDIANSLKYLTKEQRLRLYKYLDDDIVSDMFSYLDDVEEYVKELSSKQASDIIGNMDNDDAIDVLDELDAETKKRIVALLDAESRSGIDILYSYQDSEIGSKTTSNFISINKNDSVKEAMRKVIKEAADNDNVSIIFVKNTDGTYYGALELRDLIIARPTDTLASMIKTNYPSFKATEQIDECVNELKDYALDQIPVLNEADKIIGVITLDDVVESVDDALGEDYAKLAGLSSEEDFDASVSQSVKKRLPWLFILLGLGLIVAILTSLFEHVVETLAMVVFFQSFVLGMSGNSGTQSLAVTIRTITDKDIDRKTQWQMIFKELRIGLVDAFFIALTSFGVVILFLLVRSKVSGDVFDSDISLKLAAVVSISLQIAMTFSAATGCFVPLLLNRFKVDPAVASGPFITTLSDATSVVLYYGLAYLLFITLI